MNIQDPSIKLAVKRTRIFSFLFLLLPGFLSAQPQILFSPHGGIRDRIIKQTNLSKTSIDVAVFDFTSGDLAEALVKAKDRGVALRVIADPKRGADKHSETPFLLKKGVNLRLLSGKGRGIMHNKFAIFDGRILLTGSYNWTESAEKYNWENVIILEDTAVVRTYKDEFEKMWKKAE